MDKQDIADYVAGNIQDRLSCLVRNILYVLLDGETQMTAKPLIANAQVRLNNLSGAVDKQRSTPPLLAVTAA